MESQGEAATTLIAKVPVADIRDVVAPESVQPQKAKEAPKATEEDEGGDKANAVGDETDDDGEEEDDGGDAGESKSEEAAQPSRKKGGFQRKIEARDREIARLRAEKAEKDELLRLALAGKLPKDGEESPKSSEARTTDDDPKPTRDQFETYEEFTEALGEWGGRQGFRKENAAAAERAAKAASESAQAQSEAQFAKNLDAMMKRGFEKYKDFAEVQDEGVRITESMARLLAESDIGEDLAHHLSKNRDEALRIAQLAPLAQAKALGALEASLTKASTATSKTETPPVKKQSSAPPPASTGGIPDRKPGTTNQAKETLAMEDYIAARRAEGAHF